MKTLYWIDDSHDHQRLPQGAAKRNLETGLCAKLRPDKAINNRAEFAELLHKIEPENTVGMVMDYQLTEVSEHREMAYGSTWAAEVRSRHPSVPIIGISHCPENQIPKFQLESFLAFFPRKKLTDANPEIDNLKALLDGYREVYNAFKKHGNGVGIEEFLRLLNPPAATVDILRNALPSPFRADWDQETPHAAGRWIWHELQGRPGILFDGLGLATYLGLNINGLKRVVKKFDAARYKGVFASDGRPRWWVGAIRESFKTVVQKPILGPVSSFRDELLGAVRVKRSARGGLLARAHGSSRSEDIPDCVAYRDDQREDEDRIQALFKDTYVDNRDANLPFGFEPRRIFSPASLNEKAK